MSTSLAKRGRRARDHVDSVTGGTVNGLYHKPGTHVWRVRKTGQEFRERDEQRAIARFLELTQPTPIGQVKLHRTFVEAMGDVERRARAAPNGELDAMITTTGTPAEDRALVDHYSAGRVDQPNGEIFAVSDCTLNPSQWAWLRVQLLDDIDQVSSQVGLRLAIKGPGESADLKGLGELYAGKPGLSSNEASRSRLFWREFCSAVGVKTVAEVTPTGVEAYENKIMGGNLKPKSRLHRYRKIRTVLLYAIERGRDRENCRKLLDICLMLKVKGAHALDPQPIDVADYWKIHDAAAEVNDKVFCAMLLTALNCAMYSGEVAALTRDDVNLQAGTLSTRRPKTKVGRIACLWPETVKALQDLPEEGSHLFYTSRRSYTTFSVLEAWRKYRKKTLGKASLLAFGQIRDAAFQIAVEKLATDAQAKMLAGHRLSGVSDFYLRRNPRLVQDACNAIRKAFDVPGHVVSKRQSKSKPRPGSRNHGA